MSDEHKFQGFCKACNVTTIANDAVYKANHLRALKMKCGKCKSWISVNLVDGNPPPTK